MTALLRKIAATDHSTRLHYALVFSTIVVALAAVIDG